MASMVRPSFRLRSAARLPAARCLSSSAQLRAAEKPYFPNEPAGPKMVTSFPGPSNKEAADKLDKIFDSRSLNMLSDYSKSIGN